MGTRIQQQGPLPGHMLKHIFLLMRPRAARSPWIVGHWLIVVGLLLSANISAQDQTVYDQPGTDTFTVPDNVTQITVEAWGAGGKGGDSSGNGNSATGGGGGGGYSSSVISVTPGQTFDLLVGAGSSSDQPGQDSWFGSPSTLLARGGGSVPENSDSGAPGGQAGVGSIAFEGGDGADRAAGNEGGGGGSSAGSEAQGNNGVDSNGGVAPTGGGDGGNGSVDVNQNGSPGEAPGGGGGGAFSRNSSASGGHGANGQVIITYTPSPAQLIAEYRLEACEWTGAAGEVIDSAGNGLNGTVIDTDVLSIADGVINRAAQFNESGSESAIIEIPDPNNQLDDTDQLTITGWINPATYSPFNSNALGIFSKRENSGNAQNAYGMFLGFSGGGCSSNKLCIDFNGTGNRFSSTRTIPLNQWTHFALVFNRGTAQLYLNGQLDETEPNLGNSIVSSTAPLRLGDLTDGATRKPFQGGLDEFKFFRGALSEQQISEMFDNESDGRGWDGSEREPVTCTPQLSCVNDDFNRSILGDDWTATNTSGSFGNPRIVDDRFRLTNASGNVATAATFQRLFPSEGNLITLEFDYYAYGGSGADGIVVALSDAEITPAPGGYGGSLGYANRCGVDGFTGGWLGIGLDTFGNYANGSECRNGRLPGSSGRVRNAVGLRGSGSGQSGYAFIDGTNSLSPAVRTGSANVSHRYRITIDSQTDGQSWVTIERRVASEGEFEVLVGPVDVLTSAGQAAVPEDLLLTLTGSTGGANDNHEIDNLEICALSMDPVEDNIRYFRIEHSGEGLTCRAEPVTVKACANEDCSELYSGEVTLRLLPNNSSETYWMAGGNERTFSGGEATFLLRRTVEGDVAVGLTNSSPAASGVTRCVRAGQEGSCVIDFADVGLEVDEIPTQIANRPSNAGGGNPTRIRVLRTDDATGACIPALSDQTLTADFAYLNPVASQALTDNRIVLDAQSSSALTTVNQTESVDLAFDTEGIASFSFNSQDAGRHQLQIRLDIPVTDGQGEATVETLTRTTSSNAFVVRPLAIYADASGNPRALGAEDDVFHVAGDNFELDFSTVGWSGSLDANTDDQWDACGNAALGDPGIRVRVPLWNLGRPGATLVAPADGQHPGLNFADDDVQIPRGSGQIQIDTSYDEVGIIRLNEHVDFLGEAVKVCSPNIGRFIPSHFILSNATLTDRAALSDCEDEFTYLGERMEAEFSLLAQSASNLLTSNYTDDFARLDAGQLGLAASPTPTFSGTTIGWSQGTGAAETSLRGPRNAPDGPHDPFELRIEPVDSDGVALDGADLIGSTRLVFGRLVIDNAIGSELGPLDLPWRVEVWENGTWQVHAADTCTDLNLGGQVGLVNWEETTVDGTESIAIEAGGASTSISASDSVTTAASGRGHFQLTAPGAPGWVDLVLGLDPDWSFLQPDLDDDGTFNDNPSARASFGLFEGSPNRIFLREVMPR